MHNVKLMTKLLLPVVLLTFLVSGCATRLSKPAGPAQPTKVKLGQFAKVEMKAVTISEKFAGAGANQKAAAKIDQVLFDNMKNVFANLERVEEGQDFSNSGTRTLQITPVVKEIKFIGGAARFMVGAMAGSSAVLMEVTLRDSTSGEIIGQPEFYQKASAFSGAYGIADNRMLEVIAQDIVNYCSRNR